MKMSSNITTMFEYLHPIIPKYSFNDTVKQRSHVIKKDYNLLLTTINRGEEKKKKSKQKLPQHTSKSSSLSKTIESSSSLVNKDSKQKEHIKNRKIVLKSATNRMILDIMMSDNDVKNYITQTTTITNTNINTMPSTRVKTSITKASKKYPSLFLTTLSGQKEPEKKKKVVITSTLSDHQYDLTELLEINPDSFVIPKDISDTLAKRDLEKFRRERYQQFKRTIKSSITPRAHTKEMNNFTFYNKRLDSLSKMGRGIIDKGIYLEKDIDNDKNFNKFRGFENAKETHMKDKNEIESLIDYDTTRNAFKDELMRLSTFNRRNDALSGINERVVLKNPKFFRDNFFKDEEDKQKKKKNRVIVS